MQTHRSNLLEFVLTNYSQLTSNWSQIPETTMHKTNRPGFLTREPSWLTFIFKHHPKRTVRQAVRVKAGGRKGSVHITDHESNITKKKQRSQSVFQKFLLTLRSFPLINFSGRVKRTCLLGIQSMPLNCTL